MKHLAEHNVVATFPDMEKARSAVDALARAGIEAEDMSMLGSAVEEARNDTDTRLRDLEATGEIAKRAGTGIAAGGALGALAGVAAFAIPGVGPVVGGGILAAVIGGGVAGGSIGGMVGGVAGVSLEEDWDLTFQESIRDGRVLVAVHAAGKDDVDKAGKVLEDEHPDQLDWLNAEGKRVDRDGGNTVSDNTVSENSVSENSVSEKAGAVTDEPGGTA